MNKWLKVPLEEADKITNIGAEIAVDGLVIDATADVRDYLTWRTIDGFVYVYTCLFDLPNKNRMFPQTEGEEEKWLKYADDNGYQLVDELPQNEETEI